MAPLRRHILVAVACGETHFDSRKRLCARRRRLRNERFEFGRLCAAHSVIAWAGGPGNSRDTIGPAPACLSERILKMKRDGAMYTAATYITVFIGMGLWLVVGVGWEAAAAITATMAAGAVCI